VGYERYDSPAAVDTLNALYAEVRLLQNLFLPSVKLVEKTRVGSRLRRKYDTPQTPLDRLVSGHKGEPTRVQALVRQRARLDPFALAKRVDQQLERVFRLANRRTRPADPIRPSAPPKPTAVRRPVEAARPVEAQNASTRSLEKPKSGFSTATTGPHLRSGSRTPRDGTRRTRVTRILAR
jgi:hypothetical protein